MSADDALFYMPDPPAGPPVALPEPMSADRRRTARQASAVEQGQHPLGLVVPNVWRHPDTLGQTYTRDDPKGRPLTCGTCVFRVVEQHNAGTYPKCQQGGGRRVTGGPGTDIRAWWPACRDWAPQ